MSKLSNILSSTRRGFLKAAAALPAAGLIGFDKAEAATVAPEITEAVLNGTTGHNCGGRCLTKAYVKNGVIKRFDTDNRPDVKILDGDDMQYRACSRCRSYKGRLYHPGRLQYPMIQTRERGDLTGFKRISWTEALDAVAVKMKQVRDQYGPQGFYLMYGSGSINWVHGNAMMANLLRAYGGYVPYKNNYSSHQRNHIRSLNGARFRASRGNIIQTDNIVLWGSHFTVTRNSRHWPMMQAKEEVKRKGGRIIYIGPTMEESNASYADEWIPIRPGTDGALALAIMYEMVNLKLIDKNFVQKAVYGFYPCKSYWVDAKTGETMPLDPFTAEENAKADDANYAGKGDWKYIDEVPVGASLYDYLMGKSYTAIKGNDATKYPYKAHVRAPKTAKWAEGITGIPAKSIIDLAKLYGQRTKRVFTERSYGVQRNYNGSYTYHALDTLIAASGHWGQMGTGLDYYSKSFNYNEFNPSFPSISNPVPGALAASTTLWHDQASGRGRFSEIDGDVKNNNYKLIFNETNNSFEMKDGKYVAELDANGEPVKVTPKMLFNIAGNIIANQHMNLPQVLSWLKDRRAVESIVVFDNFMTPTARYADIVLPSDTSWEREDIGWCDDDDEIMLFSSKAIDPPGEAMSIHYMARELAQKLDKLGTGFEGTSLYDRITFKDKPEMSDGKNMNEGDILRYMWNRGKPRYSFEELQTQGIININKNGAERVENSGAYERIMAGEPVIPSKDFTAVAETGMNRSGKFHAYAMNIVNEYNTRGMKYANVVYSPAKITDDEGDTVAHALPLYIPLEQGFNQAGLDYKLSASDDKERTLLLISTHHKHRSHSTHNENAWLRDLYMQEATTDGTIKLARDDSSYAANPVARPGGSGLAPLYINPKDAALKGIKQGEKVKVSNKIGALYAAAKVTEIVIPGVCILYQGSWYDPDADGVDAGGNPNTLTPDIPSYIDNGNAQNAIPVSVNPVR